MSDLFEQFYKTFNLVDIVSAPGYKRAFFGDFFVVFEADDGSFCMDIQDRPALEEIIYLKKNVFDVEYKDNIKLMNLLKNYGVNEVLKIDPDNLDKIDFRDNLSSLKKESCFAFNSKKHFWYFRIMKSYLLKKGIFYPYDSPIEAELMGFCYPFYFDTRLMSDKTKKFYQEFSWERMFIELVEDKDMDLLPAMKSLAGKDLNELSKEYMGGKKQKTLESNVLYYIDAYAFDIAMIERDDFFKESKLPNNLISFFLNLIPVDEKGTVCLSAFTANMYSFDNGETFFFSKKDKKIIENAYHLARRRFKKEEKTETLLNIYWALNLPSQGYIYLKEKNATIDNMLSLLPYTDKIDDLTLLCAPIRKDKRFYVTSYGEADNHELFLNRKLIEKGILIKVVDASGTQYGVFNSVDAVPDCDGIKLLNGMTLESFYAPYLLATNQYPSESFARFLREIDSKFYNQAIEILLGHFSMGALPVATVIVESVNAPAKHVDKLVKLLNYIVEEFYSLIETDIKKEDEKGPKLLPAIEKWETNNETYENGMPLPYVSFEKTAYSFRKDKVSKPYICSCQKKQLEKKIDFLTNKVKKIRALDTNHTYTSSVEEEVLELLSIPSNIKKQIDPSKDIKAQIPYMDHICHVCNHTIPYVYDVVSANEVSDMDLMFTYIRAIGAENGVFIEEVKTKTDDDSRFFKDISEGNYNGILDFSLNDVKKYLLPYVNVDKATITAILATAFPMVLNYVGFRNELSHLMTAATPSMIRDMIFSPRDDVFFGFTECEDIINLLSVFYSRLEIAYCCKEASKKMDFYNDNYIDTVEVPGLPLPFVHPGNTFTGYSAEKNSPIIFCSCEKDAIFNAISLFASVIRSYGLPEETDTALVLALAGLPLDFILSVKDYPLAVKGVDGLLEMMQFQDGICGEENGIAYPTPKYMYPLLLDLPFKPNNYNEETRLRTKLAKEGLFISTSFDIHEARFDPDYKYDGSKMLDQSIPYFYHLYDTFSPKVEKYLMPDSDFFKSDEVKKFRDLDVYAAYAVDIIEEKEKENKGTIARFLKDYGSVDNMGNLLDRYYPYPDPDDADTRKKEVKNRMFGFFSELCSLMFKEFKE